MNASKAYTTTIAQDTRQLETIQAQCTESILDAALQRGFDTYITLKRDELKYLSSLREWLFELGYGTKVIVYSYNNSDEELYSMVDNNILPALIMIHISWTRKARTWVRLQWLFGLYWLR